MNLAVAILGLALLILVHEAGHFFVARAVGMRPRKFYVGFPPALAKVRRNGIEYGLGSIPLGGYVKIPGMHRPNAADLERWFGRREAHSARELAAALDAGDFDRAAALLPEHEAELRRAPPRGRTGEQVERGLMEVGDALGRDAYWRQRTWKKVAVIFAGPATNLVFAVALLAAVYVVGVPVDTTRTVETVVEGSPAQAAGLRAGDEILALNRRPVAPDDISTTIRNSAGRPIALVVRRDGETVRLRPVRPVVEEDAYRLGFLLEPRYEQYGVLDATRLAVAGVWQVTKGIAGSLGGLVRGENREDVSSAVGIAEASSRALEYGVRYYLQVLALISLSLALLNLLPFLPLDGGHITFSVIEGIRGRAIGREVYERASMVGIALVLFLFAIGLSNDINRLGGE